MKRDAIQKVQNSDYSLEYNEYNRNLRSFILV